MNTIELLENIKESLNKSFNLNDLGMLIEKNSDDIHILEPNNKIFKKIIVFYKNNKVKKINFVSEKPIFSLKDFTESFGEHKVGYSFRDNLTKLLFSIEEKKIKEITTKTDDKLEIKEKEIIQETPKGEKKIFKKNEPLFNSVCFCF
jgi:hypothetical protein